MMQLKQGAEQCQDVAANVDRKFETWLLSTCEFYAACVQKDSSEQETKASTDISAAVEGSRLDYQAGASANTEKVAHVFGQHAEYTTNVFKQASAQGIDGYVQKLLSLKFDALAPSISHCFTPLSINIKSFLALALGIPSYSIISPAEITPSLVSTLTFLPCCISCCQVPLT